jgi:hypothetical protein
MINPQIPLITTHEHQQSNFASCSKLFVIYTHHPMFAISPMFCYIYPPFVRETDHQTQTAAHLATIHKVATAKPDRDTLWEVQEYQESNRVRFWDLGDRVENKPRHEFSCWVLHVRLLDGHGLPLPGAIGVFMTNVNPAINLQGCLVGGLPFHRFRKRLSLFGENPLMSQPK